MINAAQTVIVKEKKVNKSKLIQHVEAKYFQPQGKSNIKREDICPGDILQIGYKIKEGEKERIQFSQGVVIAKQNRSLSQSFTLRRTVEGVGVEQIFPSHSPSIDSITLKQKSKVRRSKLYFIRGLQGKAARLKVK